MKAVTVDPLAVATETLVEARALVQTLKSLDADSRDAAEVRKTISSVLKSIKKHRTALEITLRNAGKTEDKLRADKHINLCLLIEHELATGGSTKQ